ncbi:MAG: hypothetical protein AAF581_21500 [Planctomycetota bacterium]
MIHKVAGDVLLTKAQVIAHGVAPNDNFGQGLALALREALARHVQGLSSLLSPGASRQR